MRRILIIVANDLRRRVRRPLSVVLMMIIPISITLIIGLVFGSSGDADIPRIKVLIADRDGGFFTRLIEQSMAQGDLADMIELVKEEPEEAARMMEKGEASAMIEIPEGFTDDLLDGRHTEIRLVKNPSEAFLPMIVEEITCTLAVALDGALRVFSEPVAGARSMFEGSGWPDGREVSAVFDEARTGMILARGYLADSLITYREETVSESGVEGEGSPGVNIFSWVLPGSMILGLLFISELVLRDIIREQRGGTLSRILTAPVETGHFVIGKVGATFVITMTACLLLLAVGALGFKMNTGRPGPLALQVIATILMCTGVMTFLYGMVRSERAADAIMSVVIIVLSMLGGSMIPIQSMPEGMQKIARISPVFWATRGFQKVFNEGGGLGEIRTGILVLVAVGAFTLVPGIVLIRGKVRKGGW